MREFSIPQGQQEVESGTYTITVGAGGSGATPATPGDSADGNNSSVFTGSAFEVAATGGGGGGAQGGPNDRTLGRPGGAGGGGGPGAYTPSPGAGGSGNAGSYSPPEGANGGTTPANLDGPSYGAGGGGGGGNQGSTGSYANGGGPGGPGTATTFNSPSSQTFAGGAVAVLEIWVEDLQVELAVVETAQQQVKPIQVAEPVEEVLFKADLEDLVDREKYN